MLRLAMMIMGFVYLLVFLFLVWLIGQFWTGVDRAILIGFLVLIFFVRS